MRLDSLEFRVICVTETFGGDGNVVLLFLFCCISRSLCNHLWLGFNIVVTVVFNFVAGVCSARAHIFSVPMIILVGFLSAPHFIGTVDVVFLVDFNSRRFYRWFVRLRLFFCSNLFLLGLRMLVAEDGDADACSSFRYCFVCRFCFISFFFRLIFFCFIRFSFYLLYW